MAGERRVARLAAPHNIVEAEVEWQTSAMHTAKWSPLVRHDA